MPDELDQSRFSPLPVETRPAGSGLGARLRSAWDLLRTVGAALLAAELLHTFLLQPFTIPSSSMEPGLVTGDYILVSKVAYGWSRASFPVSLPLPNGRLGGSGPRRGDVVVFRRPADPNATWIKRVIGLPGDRIEITGGVVRVNGRALPQSVEGRTWDPDAPDRSVLVLREHATSGRSYRLYGGDPALRGENTGVYGVPKDSFFVMGDNRDNSLDSRFPRDVGVGFLPPEDVVGKADLILLSWRRPSSLSGLWPGLGFQFDRFFRPID